MPNLLPCPFCGCTRITTLHAQDGRTVRCIDCKAGITRFNPDAERKAIEAWNVRAPVTP